MNNSTNSNYNGDIQQFTENLTLPDCIRKRKRHLSESEVSDIEKSFKNKNPFVDDEAECSSSDSEVITCYKKKLLK